MIQVKGPFRVKGLKGVDATFFNAFVDYRLSSQSVEVRFEGTDKLSLTLTIPEARRLVMGEPAVAELAGRRVGVERTGVGWRVDGFVVLGADRLRGAVERVLETAVFREFLGWR